MQDDHPHFCVELTAGNLPAEDIARLGSHKAAGLKSGLWHSGDVITVRFLEGDPNLQQRVKSVAKEWTAQGLANLTLDFRNQGPTDIRIAFQQGKGSWSYIGKLCRQIHEPQATMNYGWLTPDSSEDELRRVVLHEFGHAMGLIHEHQNPNHPVAWNKDAVIHDLSGPPNRWDPQTIANNMFKKYDGTEVVATPVDQTSIMMYPIPRSWTTDGFTAGLNGTLSPTDKALIRQLYP